jgi:predicted phage terminase large subunit-like protein
MNDQPTNSSETRSSETRPFVELLKEKLDRSTARQSLPLWMRSRGYVPAKHHRLIMETIERFLLDDTKQVLLLFAPPGCAKSTIVSVLLPPWYLGKFPTCNVLFATHSDEFAQRWGRACRNIVRDDGLALGIRLAGDSQANDRWALASGGEYYGVGIGAGIAGFRADLGIIDDPFGSRSDAMSDIVRKARWQWYLDDFSPRLKPKAKRIIMATRWHEEDISGHILEQIGQGKVTGMVLSLEAICTETDPMLDPLERVKDQIIWDDQPDYDYPSYVRSRQREMTTVMFSALFQQKPIPDEGEFFKAEWLKTFHTAPDRARMRIYIGTDFAVTSADGDYTVFVVVGFDPQGHLYVLDLVRLRVNSGVWIEKLLDLIAKWKPMAVGVEKGQINASVGPFLKARMRARKVHAALEEFPSRADKAVRAQSIQGRMSLDGLYLPANELWVGDLKHELFSFPAGKHDDQVDALSIIGQLLDMVVYGTPPPEITAPKKPSDYSQFKVPESPFFTGAFH